MIINECSLLTAALETIQAWPWKSYMIQFGSFLLICKSLQTWDYYSKLYFFCKKIIIIEAFGQNGLTDDCLYLIGLRIHVGRTFTVWSALAYCERFGDAIENTIGHKWMRYLLKSWEMANFAITTGYTCYYSLTRSLEIISAAQSPPVDNHPLQQFIAWFEKKKYNLLRGGGDGPLPIEGPVEGLRIEGPGTFIPTPAERVPIEAPRPPVLPPIQARPVQARPRPARPVIEGPFPVTDGEQAPPPSAQQLAIEGPVTDVQPTKQLAIESSKSLKDSFKQKVDDSGPAEEMQHWLTKKVDQLIPIFKDKLEDLSENFHEKYLFFPNEHDYLGPILMIGFFIFIYHFLLKKQTRFVVFQPKRFRLTQEQVGERVDQLFTGFNIFLVLIVIYTLCSQALSYQTVLDSLDPLFMTFILKCWVTCGCILLILRTLLQWFGVQRDDALFFFVHLANSYLLPLITLVTNFRVFLQLILHLVFPGKSIPQGIGSGSLSLGILFYIACFTFLQNNTTELFLDVLVSGTRDMSNLLLTNNDMIVGQNELLDLIPLLDDIFPD